MAIKHTVRLKCSECQNINYLTARNIKKNPDKLALKKYCNSCKKAIPHQEIKAKK